MWVRHIVNWIEIKGRFRYETGHPYPRITNRAANILRLKTLQKKTATENGLKFLESVIYKRTTHIQQLKHYTDLPKYLPDI